MNAFSVVTLGVAAAAMGCLGFAESARLLGWPLWACWLGAAVALIAGFVAFMPGVERQRRVDVWNKRQRRRRPAATPARPKSESGPVSEIPASAKSEAPPVSEIPLRSVEPSPPVARQLAPGPLPRALRIPLPPIEPLRPVEPLPPVAETSVSAAEPFAGLPQAAPVTKRKPSPRRRRSTGKTGEVIDLAAARKRSAKAKGEADNG